MHSGIAVWRPRWWETLAVAAVVAMVVFWGAWHCIPYFALRQLRSMGCDVAVAVGPQALWHITLPDTWPSSDDPNAPTLWHVRSAASWGPAVSLHLAFTKLPDDSLIPLEGMTNLEWLSLPVTSSDEAIRLVGVLPRLNLLSACFSQVGDAGVAYAVRQFPALEVISLRETPITDEALRYLAQCRHLERLTVSRTDITDDCVEYISQMHSLQVLRIYDTLITPEGARKIQDALPACRVEYGNMGSDSDDDSF